jgi:hypothetical protein
MADEKEGYLDENLTEKEKESGRLRQPTEEGEPVDTSRDTKFDTSRDTKFDTMNPDRPDEFGDGDRRS